MKKKTILFFPVEIGLAHFTRSLAIAQALKKRGHTVIISTPKRKEAIIKKTDLDYVLSNNYFEKDDLTLIHKFNDTNFDLPFVKEEEEIIKKFHPDVAVVDFRITTLPACIKYNIPTIWLTNSSGLPYSIELPDFNGYGLFKRPLKSLTNFAVNFMKRVALGKLVQLTATIGRDTTVNEIRNFLKYILPEDENYFKVIDNKAHQLNYVGPIEWPFFDSFTPDWLRQLKPDGKTVYVTFGGTGFDKRKLIEICSTLVKSGFRVIVSCGTIADPLDFPKSNNLFVGKYLSGKLACEKADIVVCHGGYGTLCQAIQAGKPVVAIPFNPDQLLHVLRFQELGLAKLAVDIKLDIMTGILKFNWDGFQKAGSATSVEHVVKTTEVVLGQKKQYKEAMERYSDWFKDKNGAEKAARLIEKL